MNKNEFVIYVIDDDPAVCTSLEWLLQSVSLKVKIFADAPSFLESYNPQEPGCIIADVRLPIMSGLELLEHLKAQKSFLPIILITAYGDIPMAIRAMKAGACDFILKPINEQYLLEILYQCISQIDTVINYEQIRKRINQLSERERQIINLVLEGKLNKQIAHEISVSISTVEAHRANIMQKMQAKNLAHLIKLFLQVQLYIEFSQ